jgi:SpoVK/Ycf46/Vps4 family AAA+-type ATPase
MKFLIDKLPDLSGAQKDIFRSRLYRGIDDILARHYPKEKREDITIAEIGDHGKSPSGQMSPQNDESEDEKRAGTVAVIEPQFTFEQIVLNAEVKKELEYAIQFEGVRDFVYETWNMKRIDPSPKLALNFHGPSGTGKTMTAHALASAMGKKIIPASYAEIESKYVGEGPKNVKKLFHFASENNTVLFIDEADSLLSRRLTNIEHGSEQSLNSMRSQLLIEIEKFSGTVIFATNLAVNYDGAFKTRMKSIHFTKPGKELRHDLWQKMLAPPLPLAPDVDFNKLAEIEDVVGRDIKNAVLKAAIITAINKNTVVTQLTLVDAINDIIASNKEMDAAGPKPLTDEEKQKIGSKIKRSLRKRSTRFRVYKK